jgi:hypothetical protein
VTVDPLKWELVNPEGAARPALLSPAPRPTTLEGKLVGLLWNGKPGGETALEEIAAGLTDQVPGVRFIRYWQTLPATVSERELSATVIQSVAAEQPDVVVASQGD